MRHLLRVDITAPDQGDLPERVEAWLSERTAQGWEESTVADGEAIPIEQRDPREITHAFGRQTAPPGIKVYNPAFDVTPAELITAIICEKGIIRPVTRERIAEVVGGVGR